MSKYAWHLLATIHLDAVMGKFYLQQPNQPHYHDWAKERPQKWQCTCWSQEVWKLRQHLLNVHLLNWIINKISRQIYKKGFSTKISTMKNQNFYIIKIASTKATVCLENYFAIFWQQLRRAYKALFQCLKQLLRRQIGLF